ncbi:hypothetical protein SAMN05216359_101558 [Roseateles sp. YR242]|nr:hypothetical protein SAMN05216359_101558 [Roseateles sp. YR242]
MCALGSALSRTPGFPADRAVVAGDLRDAGALHGLLSEVPQFTLVTGMKGQDGRTTDAMHVFIYRPEGIMEARQEPCEATGDNFFRGLSSLLYPNGLENIMFALNRVPAADSAQMWRRLLADQLAIQSPRTCEDLAARLTLFRREEPRGACSSTSTVSTSTAPRPQFHRPWEPLVPTSNILDAGPMDIDDDVDEDAGELEVGRPVPWSVAPTAYRPGPSSQGSVSPTFPFTSPDARSPATSRRMMGAAGGARAVVTTSPAASPTEEVRLLTPSPRLAAASSPLPEGYVALGDWLSQRAEHLFREGLASEQGSPDPGTGSVSARR